MGDRIPVTEVRCFQMTRSGLKVTPRMSARVSALDGGPVVPQPSNYRYWKYAQKILAFSDTRVSPGGSTNESGLGTGSKTVQGLQYRPRDKVWVVTYAF